MESYRQMQPLDDLLDAEFEIKHGMPTRLKLCNEPRSGFEVAEMIQRVRTRLPSVHIYLEPYPQDGNMVLKIIPSSHQSHVPDGYDERFYHSLYPEVGE